MAGKVLGEEAGKALVAKVKSLLAGKSDAGHTHSYAGSASAGGSATSAVKLDSSAGSATKPVYFTGGKPAACSYTLGASVPSGAKFTDTTYSAATTSTAGLMSAGDKSKLNGIDTGANAFYLASSTNPDASELEGGTIGLLASSPITVTVDSTSSASDNNADFYIGHSTAAGCKHIPAGGSSGQVLTWSADGTAKWASASGASYTLPTATASTLGGVKVGTGLSVTTAGVLSHSTAAGYKHVPSGGSSGQVLRYSSAGTAKWDAQSASLYSNTTGSTSVSLSSAITNYNYILVCIKNAQGAHHWVAAKAAAGDCPFETHGVTSGTMWVVFGTLNLASTTVKITSQVNMPISGYAFGTGSSNIDCKIVQVRGCY